MNFHCFSGKEINRIPHNDMPGVNLLNFLFVIRKLKEKTVPRFLINQISKI